MPSLRDAIDSNDPELVLAAMHEVLSSGLVKWNALTTEMKRYNIPINLILSCIEVLVSDRSEEKEKDKQGGRLSVSAAHLLIDLADGRGNEELLDCQPRAAELFEGLIRHSTAHARLAPKIASCFLLEIQMIKDGAALMTFLRSLFESRATFAPALSLLETFPSLNEEFDKSTILTSLVEAGQEEAATKWVGLLDKDTQILLVEILIANDRWKAAAQAVRSHTLRETFPDVESQYVQKTVQKLVGKKLWTVAIEFCGSDTALQSFVLRSMVEEGEMASASEFRQLLSLPESSIVIDEDAMRAEQERRATEYLQLSSYRSISSILWVDSISSLRQAHEALSNSAGPVGIDVEWKPTSVGGGGGSRASIMQLATENEVMIFDLISLASQPKLSEEFDLVLTPVMKNKGRLKLGFEIGGDFKVLRSSYPSMVCFHQINGIMDLKNLWFKYLEVNGGGRTKRGAGLSTLCQALLGKPLDKSSQVSNWEARPLRAKQLEYAALDSLSLILLFKKFEEILPTGVMAKVISISSYDSGGRSYDSGGSETRKETENDQDEDDDDDKPGPSQNEGISRIDSKWKDIHLSNNSVESSSAPATDLPPVIRACLEKLGLTNNVVWKERDAGRILISAEDAARSLGVDSDRIVKSMALWVRSSSQQCLKGSTGLVCALRGSKKLDLLKVAKALGVNRKQLSFASRQECLTRFGYASGSLPPCGYHLQPIKVLFDNGLRKYYDGSDHLYCGVGVLNASLRLSLDQLFQLSDGVEADIVLDADMARQEEVSETEEVSSKVTAGPSSSPQESVKFVCDSMLGRPHRWLRCLGIESTLLSADISRADVVALARPDALQGRVFLTLDFRLASRREVSHASCYVLTSKSPSDQLREICHRFNIKLEGSELLSRCPVCGAKAFREIDRELVRGKVCDAVMESVVDFFECGSCSKIFWMGPKSERAIQNLEQILRPVN